MAFNSLKKRPFAIEEEFVVRVHDNSDGKQLFYIRFISLLTRVQNSLFAKQRMVQNMDDEHWENKPLPRPENAPRAP